MSYLIILLLSLRPFICEQVSVTSGLLFNFVFCGFFLIYILFRKNLNIKTPLVFLGLAFPLLIYLSNFYSVNSYNSQSALLGIFVLVCMFTFVYSLNEKERSFLLKMMIGAGVVIGLRALYQHFLGLEYIKNNFSTEEITREGFYALQMLKHRRIVSWFTAPNLLASYLLMIIPVTGVLLVSSIQKQKRAKMILFSCALFLLLVALLLTKSIGAYISLMLGLLFLFMMLSKTIKPEFILKPAVYIFFILCFLFAGMFLKRSDFFLNMNNPQNSLVQRVYYWQTAKTIIQEHPFMGVGAGNFGIIYPRYKNIKANETIYAHNSYLQLWAESGFFTLLFLAGFIGLIFKSSRRENSSIMNSAVIAGCLAFLIHNLVDYSFFISQVSAVWWILLGCVLAGQNRADLRSAKIIRENSSLIKLGYLCLGLIILFNIYLELNSQVNIDKAISYLKKKAYRSSINSVNNALRYKPNSDFAYYILALTNQSLEKGVFSEKVIDDYKHAIYLNPQYSFYYYYLSRYYFYFHMYEEGMKYYLKAIDLYPGNKDFTAE